MLTCPKCNQVNYDQASKCFKCGHEFPWPPQTPGMPKKKQPSILMSLFFGLVIGIIEFYFLRISLTSDNIYTFGFFATFHVWMIVGAATDVNENASMADYLVWGFMASSLIMTPIALYRCGHYITGKFFT